MKEDAPLNTEAPDDTREDALAPDFEQVAHNTVRKLLTLLAIGAALLLVIHATPFGEHVRNWDSLTDLFKAGGINAQIYFLVISTVLIMAGTPRLLFCTLGGFAFGFWEGLLWSTCSSLIGSFLTFRAARWGGRAWLTEHFGRRRFFARIVHAQPTVASVALIRMLPVSNVIINVGLALSHVGNRAFVVGSVLGFLPQGVVAVIIGSGMAENVPWAGAAQIAIAGVLLLAIFFWTLRHRRKQH
jgi:uncharacterized membrane protein YdjX (TVP38/TMEM64 family)